MAVTAHVYQIFIAADAAQVWQAITDSDWTRQYFHATGFANPLASGEPYRMVMGDGSGAIDGTVEELIPPDGDRPGRLVQTWHVLYDAAMEAEPPSRVEWTVQQVGEHLTRIRLVHGDLAASPLTWATVKDGWVWILDGLKTLLETGRPLPEPRATEDEPVSGNPTGDWHRRQAIEANNAAWELLGAAERTPQADEQALRTAYAAAYHWQRATGAGPANEARAGYLIAKALLATGQGARAMITADRCLELCREHELADFDLAYAHEARARALAATGRQDEAREAAAAARAVPVADPEDREIVDADLADLADLLSVAPEPAVAPG